jgi:hypothetical protein
MGFLSRKPKISIEEFCQQFYASQIFHPTIAGEDVWAGFLGIAFKSVVEVDQSFAVIDPTVFKREMTALRIELFGLAWGHKFKQERFTIPQSIYTRQYLERNRKLKIWDIMGEYNQAIAQSTTMTETGEQVEGRIARARGTSLNLSRAKMFDRWAEANIGDLSAPTKKEKILANCVARVANRIGADIKRSDCILVKRLAARLADRLGCDINLGFEALLRLGAVIFGLYEGAMKATKSVNLQEG